MKFNQIKIFYPSKGKTIEIRGEINNEEYITLIEPLFEKYGDRCIKIFWNDVRYPIKIRNGTTDSKVFEEIFIRKEYDFRLPFKIKNVIDVGANSGISSIFFLKKFKDLKIISIEPENSNFNILKENLSFYRNVNLVKSALWNKKTNLLISNLDYADKWGFMVKESFVKPNINTFKSITIPEIIRRFKLKHIDLLKIDIEGSERELFLENTDWLNNVKSIIIELHEKMRGGSIESFNNALKNYNFKEIRLEGKYAKHLRLLVNKNFLE